MIPNRGIEHFLGERTRMCGYNEDIVRILYSGSRGLSSENMIGSVLLVIRSRLPTEWISLLLLADCKHFKLQTQRQITVIHARFRSFQMQFKSDKTSTLSVCSSDADRQVIDITSLCQEAPTTPRRAPRSVAFENHTTNCYDLPVTPDTIHKRC